MRKLFFVWMICGVFLASGCAHIPIKSVSLEETRALLDNFQSRLANKYEILNLVVFKYRFFSISSLGMTSVDLAKDHLAVAGVTPVGITLFRVVSDGGKITESFVVPELAKRGDVARVVAGNIRDIYFDLSPAQVMSACSRDGKVYFKTQLQDRSQKEYVFSDEERTLLEKRLYKDGKLFWRIFYSGWLADSSGKIHPEEVRLLHRAYKYQLLLNLKEVRPL